jgi:hypothetical protein
MPLFSRRKSAPLPPAPPVLLPVNQVSLEPLWPQASTSINTDSAAAQSSETTDTSNEYEELCRAPFGVLANYIESPIGSRLSS